MIKQLLFFTMVMTVLSVAETKAQNGRWVRLAKLTIVSGQLDKYKAELKEEIEKSIETEPGVLSLYAVSEKNDPTKITILEIYADKNAYEKHVKTVHFLKYKNATATMVKTLELVETDPLLPDMKIK